MNSTSYQIIQSELEYYGISLKKRELIELLKSHTFSDEQEAVFYLVSRLKPECTSVSQKVNEFIKTYAEEHDEPIEHVKYKTILNMALCPDGYEVYVNRMDN